MPPTLLARTVLRQAGRISDAQVTGDIRDHAGWRLEGVFQKCAQISHRAPLQREAATVVIAPAYHDELAVRIIEMKGMGQLIGSEVADLAAIASLLVVGDKADRHGAWPSSGHWQNSSVLHTRVPSRKA